jgi:P4 family phage/plasmid primase-like protien
MQVPSATETQRGAAEAVQDGLAVIPVPPGEKNPNRPGWQNERWSFEDIPRLFNNGQGVGVLWGEPSGGVVDLDTDWREATGAARYIMPDTRTFGRPGAPESHRVYRVTGTFLPQTKRYKIGGGGEERSVVELLSTGTQSLVPPSLHSSGERRVWYGERPIAEVDGRTLMEGAADVATSALIARNWPGVGARHDYTLAATGYIGRRLPRDRAERVMEAAISASGDEEASGRMRDVADTLDKLDAGKPTTGGPTLDQLAPGVVDQLQRWHSWQSESSPTTARNGDQKPPFGGQGMGVIKLLADAILAEDHFAQDAGGKLYRFSGGVYRQYAERYIRRRVKEILEEHDAADKWSSHRANEVVEYIRTDAPELWERPPLNEVNVLNGILNVVTKQLQAHDPAFLSPVQIPVEYDPSATCPEWEKFVAEVFPEDAQELAFEMPADLITPSRSAQKAILLLGEGSNGKSTYLRALAAVVGSTNVAGASLHKLESDRFATARLIGKLANICPDLPSTHLTETSVFKAITGGDDLHAEYKYRESFEFRPYCRLVFSANHVPRSGDASHAFFRRWLVIPLERTFEPDEQIPREELDAKLADPRELSGVLNRALDVLPRVRREGFTGSESMREAWEEFKAMTDPVSVFLAQHTIEAANAWVTKADLLTAYNRDCDKHGRAGLNKTAFGLALKRARPGIGEAQRTVHGRVVWCYTGIGLRPDGGGEGGDSSEGAASGDPRSSRSSRSSTNCFEFECTDEADRPEETNKGNRVNRVNPVSAGDDYDHMVEETRRRLEEKL